MSDFMADYFSKHWDTYDIMPPVLNPSLMLSSVKKS